MCNSYYHSPECQCGFGGPGHAGRSAGKGPYSKSREHLQRPVASCKWQNRTMREIAFEIGRSLLFPTRCWYCGRTIFLFASPNGGFVIFDDVGRPWPLHDCGANASDPMSLKLMSPENWDAFDLPVPIDVHVGGYDPNRTLKGLIVKSPEEVLINGRTLRKSVLFDGRLLYRVMTEAQIRLGDFISGVAKFVPMIGTCLAYVEQISPDFKLVQLPLNVRRYFESQGHGERRTPRPR
jgi:hypothetical protein